uniref:Uncharacterized protein n=1 Tax=Sinocyclocheilus rhinocerous TaxID=307959 RepID=A0A673HU01_9TELE
MEHRFDRAAAVLSPLEESSAEVSRDSGIVSQSASSLSMVSEALSSGTVSQSPSFGAAVAQSPSSAAGETQPEQTQDDELLRHTAITYSSYIRANAEEEVRKHECCIRNDTSQVVNENLPQIQRKSEEMREIYRKIDKLEVIITLKGSYAFMLYWLKEIIPITPHDHTEYIFPLHTVRSMSQSQQPPKLEANLHI